MFLRAVLLVIKSITFTTFQGHSIVDRDDGIVRRMNRWRILVRNTQLLLRWNMETIQQNIKINFKHKCAEFVWDSAIVHIVDFQDDSYDKWIAWIDCTILNLPKHFMQVFDLVGTHTILMQSRSFHFLFTTQHDFGQQPSSSFYDFRIHRCESYHSELGRKHVKLSKFRQTDTDAES